MRVVLLKFGKTWTNPPAFVNSADGGDGWVNYGKLWLTIVNHWYKIMTRKRGKQKTSTRSKPFYSLAEVKQLVKEGNVAIRENARNTAFVDFGWTANDIIAAIKKLKVSHFYKSEPSDLIENCMIDYYKESFEFLPKCC